MQNRNAIRLREIVFDRRPARSPIVGIPVVLESGDLTCVRVRRDLLASALTFAEVAYWDEKSNRLIVNGGKRSCWKLISLTRSEAAQRLDSWARTQRGKVLGKTATRGDKKAAKLQKEIAVLQRRRAKIYIRRPINPVCVDHKESACEWTREAELRWHNGKATRKALSCVFTGPALKSIGFVSRPDWKALYAEAARVLGMETIPDRDRHARITRLTRGPDLREYLREAYKHLTYMPKPSRPGKHWSYDDRPLNVRMREARAAFLEDVSSIRAIDAQIENLREVQRAARESVQVAA